MGCILVGMVLMLLGIHNLVHHNNWEDRQSTDDLRKEIDEDFNVISGSSVFSHFLVSKEQDSLKGKRPSGSSRR